MPATAAAAAAAAAVAAAAAAAVEEEEEEMAPFEYRWCRNVHPGNCVTETFAWLCNLS